MTTNFGLLVLSGCLIIVCCFIVSVTVMNWRQWQRRRLVLFLNLIPIVLTLISIYFLFHRS